MDVPLIATCGCAACGARIPASPATSARVEAALPDSPRLMLRLCPACAERVRDAIVNTVVQIGACHGYRGGAARATGRDTRAGRWVGLSALVGRRLRRANHPNGPDA